ncbi:AAA family ATPase [Acidianus sp. HS-5]|uniref:AAA family ATPase n=1 Tax=Acidianus sp. HS-5 TaxID=2886040 RepID=UPI001F39CEDF|nr:AAA family ATPase [Acidianus sp. HS-5]BDC17556.1 hypothetical protein HS5_04460 [Acidianus sp. HS-5]
MDWKVTLKNIGPFKGAEVNVKPLTIFVGKNSTGKSFLLRLLYAFSTALPNTTELIEKAHSPLQEVLSCSFRDGIEKSLRDNFGNNLLTKGENEGEIDLSSGVIDLKANVRSTLSVTLTPKAGQILEDVKESL